MIGYKKKRQLKEGESLRSGDGQTSTICQKSSFLCSVLNRIPVYDFFNHCILFLFPVYSGCLRSNSSSRTDSLSLSIVSVCIYKINMLAMRSNQQ